MGSWHQPPKYSEVADIGYSSKETQGGLYVPAGWTALLVYILGAGEFGGKCWNHLVCFAWTALISYHCVSINLPIINWRSCSWAEGCDRPEQDIGAGLWIQCQHLPWRIRLYTWAVCTDPLRVHFLVYLVSMPIPWDTYVKEGFWPMNPRLTSVMGYWLHIKQDFRHILSSTFPVVYCVVIPILGHLSDTQLSPYSIEVISSPIFFLLGVWNPLHRLS